MHGLRVSTMAPFNEGHLLSGGGIGVGYPVFIEINELSTPICNINIWYYHVLLCLKDIRTYILIYTLARSGL